MLYLLIWLQIMDFITTHYAVGKLGLVERNPIVNWGIRVFGLPMGLLIAKGLGIAAGFMLQSSFLLTTALCVVYGYVIWSNLKEINRVRDKK